MADDLQPNSKQDNPAKPSIYAEQGGDRYSVSVYRDENGEIAVKINKGDAQRDEFTRVLYGLSLDGANQNYNKLRNDFSVKGKIWQMYDSGERALPNADEAAYIAKYREADKKYAEKLDEHINLQDKTQQKSIVVCESTNALKIAGIYAKHITLPPRVIKKCLAPDVTRKIKNAHNLDFDILADIPSQLRNPAFILKSQTDVNSFIAVTDLKDKKDRPILIVLTVSKVNNQDKCEITSVYGRNDFENWLQRNADDKTIIAYNNKKSNKLFRFLPGLQLTLEEQQLITYNDNIAYSQNSVKIYNEKDKKSADNLLRSEHLAAEAASLSIQTGQVRDGGY